MNIYITDYDVMQIASVVQVTPRRMKDQSSKLSVRPRYSYRKICVTITNIKEHLKSYPFLFMMTFRKLWNNTGIYFAYIKIWQQFLITKLQTWICIQCCFKWRQIQPVSGHLPIRNSTKKFLFDDKKLSFIATAKVFAYPARENIPLTDMSLYLTYVQVEQGWSSYFLKTNLYFTHKF